MCTAVTYKTKDFYFGRTLDYEISFAEEVTVTPRAFPLAFRQGIILSNHYAIIGMAHVLDGYPLYFDAVNEKGLAMACLNFVGYAHYGKNLPDRENVAQFELIPWVLAQCASIQEASALLDRLNVTAEAFSSQLPPAQLHWILADSRECLVLESLREGLRIYPNPVGVLTNNPSFDDQLFHLNNYLHLSPEEPENRFSDQIDLKPYSRGMGALGLPGDLSSQSRFVRAAFTRPNSRSGSTEAESVSQFFHILGAVSQSRGCCHLGGGAYEITRYTSCCNTDKGIYYYTTYDNHRITGVNMHRTDLDGSYLVRYPLVTGEQILEQN